jgi:hypothetical protein
MDAGCAVWEVAGGESELVLSIYRVRALMEWLQCKMYMDTDEGAKPS